MNIMMKTLIVATICLMFMATNMAAPGGDIEESGKELFIRMIQDWIDEKRTQVS